MSTAVWSNMESLITYLALVWVWLFFAAASLARIGSGSLAGMGEFWGEIFQISLVFMISGILAGWHTQAPNPRTDPRGKSTDPTTGREWPERRGSKRTNLDILDRAVPSGQFESKVGHLINVRPPIRVRFQHVPWQNHHHRGKERGERVEEREIERHHVTDSKGQSGWSVWVFVDTRKLKE